MKQEEFNQQMLQKLDAVLTNMTDIKVENATQTADISHIKVDLEEHKKGVQTNSKRLTVVEKQVAFVPQLIKLIATSGTIVALVLGLNKIFSWF